MSDNNSNLNEVFNNPANPGIVSNKILIESKISVILFIFLSTFSQISDNLDKLVIKLCISPLSDASSEVLNNSAISSILFPVFSITDSFISFNEVIIDNIDCIDLIIVSTFFASPPVIIDNFFILSNKIITDLHIISDISYILLLTFLKLTLVSPILVIRSIVLIIDCIFIFASFSPVSLILDITLKISLKSFFIKSDKIPKPNLIFIAAKNPILPKS